MATFYIYKMYSAPKGKIKQVYNASSYTQKTQNFEIEMINPI